jgi:hypothetical protein
MAKNDESSALRSARTQSVTARSRAEAARLEHERASSSLAAHDARIKLRRRAIKDLARELRRDRSELKQLTGERERWAKEEKKSRKKAAAQAKAARRAEAGYDQATLRDLVKRAERDDLDRHGQGRRRPARAGSAPNGHRVKI